MKTIWKYQIQTTDYQDIEMPIEAQILTVQVQNGEPCLWALIDPDQKRGIRQIRIIGTGHIIDNSIDEYLGTYQLRDGALVFHVFDQGYKKLTGRMP